jgi:hypothetical protein
MKEITFCKREIIEKIINSLLAGALVFFGSISAGNIQKEQIFISVGTSIVVAITQFKEYWEVERKKGEKLNLFTFVRLC